MITPRGSFACAAIPNSDKILVAGGGSRHAMFGAAGSRMSSVEMYDTKTDEWVALDGLPRFRAGCVGFFISHKDNAGFWVMGGYGESRTVSGMFPVDEYYRDAVVMDLKTGGRWIEVGDMWEEGERRRLGKIVVIEDEDWDFPGIFMLDGAFIFRYDMTSNRWWKETSVPKKIWDDRSVGFVALNGELHVMMFLKGGDSTSDPRKSRQHRKGGSVLMQVYHPRKKTWRTVAVNSPLPHGFDFKTAVICTVQV